MKLRQLRIRCAAGAAAVPLRRSRRPAQSGAIQFIVGTAPGGAIDPYARIIADPWPRRSASTIIVENKPGANGNISAQYIADPPADGKCLGRHPGVHRDQSQRVREPALVDRRFLPFIQGVEAPLVFVVHPSVPANELRRISRPGRRPTAASSAIRPTRPARRRISSASSSTRSSISTSPMCPIAARACRRTALVAGHSQFGFAQVNTRCRNTRRQAQGVRRHQRRRGQPMPDVPTFAELGYPEFTARVWFGLLVKAGTPPDIVDRLTDAAKAAHADPEVRSKLEAQGYRGHRRNRAAAPARHQEATGALGADREGGRLLRRGPRQHPVAGISRLRCRRSRVLADERRRRRVLTSIRSRMADAIKRCQRDAAGTRPVAVRRRVEPVGSRDTESSRATTVNAAVLTWRIRRSFLKPPSSADPAKTEARESVDRSNPRRLFARLFPIDFMPLRTISNDTLLIRETTARRRSSRRGVRPLRARLVTSHSGGSGGTRSVRY